MKFIKITILFALVSISMGGCIYINGGSSCDKEVKKPFEMTTEDTSGKTFVCKTQFGDIRINGCDTDTCEISGKIIAKAETIERAQELIDNTEIVKEISGGKITVKPVCNIHKTKKETVGASFTISMASDTTLDLDTSFGVLVIDNISKPIKANTSFGDIKVKNCKGDPDLNTSYGDVKVENQCCSKAKINTSFGDIKFSGSDLPDDFNCNLNTSYGDINLSNLDKYAGIAKLTTSFGKVQCDKPITISGSINKDNIKGTIGNGSGSITASTSFGDIVLE